ncbi:hypothetical protein DL770_006196 [Monosporascus sp. CRB-9-2]|nr:hypothetical protein DL770_006196 [Monosporascus sp. CRB-9-2]
MTSFVVKKLFGEYAKNRFGCEDPYFEYVPATRLNGKPSGKLKRVKKALPPGISEHDAQVLTKMKRRAYRLDSGLCSFCGTRMGWDSVIGLVPVFGDVLAFLLALMVIHTAKQVEGGLPFTLKARMYALALVDFIVGLIPFVGDIADAIFKSNNRNTIALEAYLRDKGIKNLQKRGSVLELKRCLPVQPKTPSRPLDLRHRGLVKREYATIEEAGQVEAGMADSAAGADQLMLKPAQWTMALKRGSLVDGKVDGNVEVSGGSSTIGGNEVHRNRLTRRGWRREY